MIISSLGTKIIINDRMTHMFNRSNTWNSLYKDRTAQVCDGCQADEENCLLRPLLSDFWSKVFETYSKTFLEEHRVGEPVALMLGMVAEGGEKNITLFFLQQQCVSD